MDVPIQSSNIFSDMVIIELQNMNVARYNEQRRITYNKCVWMCGGSGTTHQTYLISGGQANYNIDMNIYCVTSVSSSTVLLIIIIKTFQHHWDVF